MRALFQSLASFFCRHSIKLSVHSGVDRRDHAFHVRQNGGVSKAQDLEAMGRQHAGPFGVAVFGLVRIMLAAIGFDHQAATQTAEVGDIGTDGRLPPEMGSLQLDLMPQRPPEPLFSGRHRGAHAPGEKALAGRGPGMSGLAGGHSVAALN